MSDFLTHVAAIAIGVGVTLLLVGGFNNATASTTKSNKEDSTTTTEGGNNNNNNKKKNRKKNKKKSATTTTSTTTTTTSNEPASTPSPVTTTPPPAAAFKAVPIIEFSEAEPENFDKEEKVKAPQQQQQQVQSSSNNGGGKKKKTKKKKNTNTNTNNTSNGNSTPASDPVAPTATPAPAAPAPVAVAYKPVVPSTYVQPFQARVEVEEEWESVPVQKKKMKKVKKVAVLVAANGEATGVPVPKETVTIDASRVGIIIGPKGATMIAIQERTGVKLDVNAPKQEESSSAAGGGGNQFRPVLGGRKTKVTATVVITEGTNESRVIAKKAILELADRGYAALLQGDQFGEATVSIHPKYISEIVGTGGKIIKAIQSELDVKLTIPKTDWTPKSIPIGNIQPTCRIGIAGDDPRNVKTAKQVVKDICNYHHHEITHPGFSHEEVYVPQEFFHCVIGPRGSEIKHIRGNYNVDVYMPSPNSTSENVICVGRPKDVEKAISYIKLLMDRDSELREEKYSDEHYGHDADGW